jgi:hypothetical protein
MRETVPGSSDSSTTHGGAGRSMGANRSDSGDSASGPKQAVNQAQEAAKQAKEQVQERVAPLVDQAQETVSQVTDQAGQMAASRLEGQKERVVDGLGQVARAIRQTCRELQEEQPMVAQYAETMADKVEGFGNYIRHRDVNQLVDEAERFGRRRPTLLLGGGFALGLLVARFLRSSSRQATVSGDYQPGYQQTGSRYGYTSYGRPEYSPQSAGGGMYGRETYGTGTFGSATSSGSGSVGYGAGSTGTPGYSAPVERSGMDRVGGQQTSTPSKNPSSTTTPSVGDGTPTSSPAGLRTAGESRSGDAPGLGE